MVNKGERNKWQTVFLFELELIIFGFCFSKWGSNFEMKINSYLGKYSKKKKKIKILLTDHFSSPFTHRAPEMRHKFSRKVWIPFSPTLQCPFHPLLTSLYQSKTSSLAAFRQNAKNKNPESGKGTCFIVWWKND